MRGRRSIHDLEVTRPESVLATKKGTTGKLLQLTSNYFEIQRKKEWGLYQYHVDFAPEIDITGVRKSLLRPFKTQFKGFVFDGSMLWTTTKMVEDVTTITTKKHDDTPVIITIKFTKEILMTENASLQILNVILRDAMEKLRLQLVGRNFFDPVAKVREDFFLLFLFKNFFISCQKKKISSKLDRKKHFFLNSQTLFVEFFLDEII